MLILFSYKSSNIEILSGKKGLDKILFTSTFIYFADLMITAGRTMSSSAPSYERKEVGLMPGRHLTNNAKSLVSTEDGVDATAKHRQSFHLA